MELDSSFEFDDDFTELDKVLRIYPKKILQKMNDSY